MIHPSQTAEQPPVEQGRSVEAHYAQLLQLDTAWCVSEVRVRPEVQRVELHLRHVPGELRCPQCGRRRSTKDRSPVRSWLHLDTMEFQTVILARIPRTLCAQCGVKQVHVPWAQPRGRFTRQFEAFACRVLRSSALTVLDDLVLTGMEAPEAVDMADDGPAIESTGAVTETKLTDSPNRGPALESGVEVRTSTTLGARQPTSWSPRRDDHGQPAIDPAPRNPRLS